MSSRANYVLNAWCIVRIRLELKFSNFKIKRKPNTCDFLHGVALKHHHCLKAKSVLSITTITLSNYTVIICYLIHLIFDSKYTSAICEFFY